MLRYLTLGIFTLTALGCDLFNPDEDILIEFTDELRVIPSRGVDNVKFGHSYEDVIALLGEPSGALGYAAGPRAWLFIQYRDSVYAGLSVYFVETLDDDFSANRHPVDFLSMDTLYTGKAMGGVGIGSTVEEFTAVYGAAVTTDTSSSSVIHYYYCYGNKQLDLTAVNSVIANMSVGYFKWVESNPCN